MIALKCSMFARKAAPLPYDYEVEYLECTGDQWANVGVYADINTSVDVVGGFRTLNNGDTLISMDHGGESNRSFNVGYWGGGYGIFGAFDSVAVVKSQVVPVLGRFYSIRNDSSGITIDGVKYTRGTPQNFTSTYPLILFRYSRNGAPIASIKSYSLIKSMKIYSGDSVIRDLVPCVEGGVPCFYNRAFSSDGTHGLEFYASESGSAFVAGPRI